MIRCFQIGIKANLPKHWLQVYAVWVSDAFQEGYQAMIEKLAIRLVPCIQCCSM